MNSAKNAKLTNNIIIKNILLWDYCIYGVCVIASGTFLVHMPYTHQTKCQTRNQEESKNFPTGFSKLASVGWDGRYTHN